MKSLKTVTDRFSLVETIRKHTTQNGRNYVLESVRNTFNRPDVKERIALGEMYGYYGHGRRAMHYDKTKSLKLPEVSVVMVEGKPVVLDNVPSNRTLAVSLDDNGIVTHTQEILDTEPGRIVQGMHDSSAGGWSWATSGSDNALSLVRSFDGFDYVTTPNYISLDRSIPMFESANERETALLAGLIAQGHSESAAADIARHFETLKASQAMFEAANAVELESVVLSRDAEIVHLKEQLKQQTAMMESQSDVAKQRRRVLKNTLNNLPIFFSEAQRQAICRLETVEDAEVVAAMLESISGDATKNLPIGSKGKVEPPKTVNDNQPLIWLSNK